MGKILLFNIVLAVGCLCACSAALAEYNPATGGDDIIFIGEAKEVAMGKNLARQAEDKFGLVHDADMQQRVREVGQRIAAVCDRPQITYSFRVLAGEELEKEQRYNAFALPGGYVYIFKEMVEDMNSDDELAAILAHEVGHIVAKHSVKKLQNAIGLTGLSLLGAVTSGDRDTRDKSSFAIAELMMSYSRQAELEADKLSVQYLKAAGFEPEAAVTFIDRMLDKQMKGEIRQYHYFRTHPYTSERRAMLNKEINGQLAFDDYINITTETDEAF